VVRLQNYKKIKINVENKTWTERYKEKLERTKIEYEQEVKRDKVARIIIKKINEKI
jgi:hypothetical protein